MSDGGFASPFRLLEWTRRGVDDVRGRLDQLRGHPARPANGSVDPVHDDGPGAEPLAWCSIVLARGVGEAKFDAFVFEADGRRSLIACSEAFPLTRASGARDRGATRHAHDVLVARFESLGWTRIATAGRWHDTALVLRAPQKPADNADETSAPAAEVGIESATAAKGRGAKATAAPKRKQAPRSAPKRGSAGSAGITRTNRRSTWQPAVETSPEPPPAAPPERQVGASVETSTEPPPAAPPDLQVAGSAETSPETPPAAPPELQVAGSAETSPETPPAASAENSVERPPGASVETSPEPPPAPPEPQTAGGADAPPEPPPLPPERQTAGSAHAPPESPPPAPPEPQAAASAETPPEPQAAGSAKARPGASTRSKDGAGPKPKRPKTAQSQKRQRRSKVSDADGKR